MARPYTLRAFGLQVSLTSFSGVTFVLFCLVFRLYAFAEAAALRSKVLRYAGASIATRVSFFLPFVYLEMSLFPRIFCTISAFSCMESASYVLFFQIVFFYLVTMGWNFDISLRENSINQSRRPDSHTCLFLCSFFPLVYLEMSLFPSIFCTIAALSLSTSYVLSFRLLNI